VSCRQAAGKGRRPAPRGPPAGRLGQDLIVIVTGSRKLGNRLRLETVLAGYLADARERTERLLLIPGACPTGAANHAPHWANRMVRKLDPVDYRRFVAEWGTHGRAAGPFRNTEMVKSALQEHKSTGEPLYCVAFLKEGERNRGTLDCASRAQQLGVYVRYLHEK